MSPGIYALPISISPCSASEVRGCHVDSIVRDPLKKLG
jgi:hypothetical protein